MLKAKEYVLWPQPPKPLTKALAITLGPSNLGEGLPYNQAYALVKQPNGVLALYKETTKIAEYPGIRAFEERFSVAIAKDGVWIAAQTGEVGGARNQPQQIKVYRDGELLWEVTGYDPQLIFTPVLYQEYQDVNLECLWKTDSVALLYMGTDGVTLKVKTAYVEFDAYTFETPHKLVRAIPVKNAVQLWLLDTKGRWVGGTVNFVIALPHLSGTIQGPERWNDPQDGSFSKVYGKQWRWSVDKAENRFVFFSKDAHRSISVPHSLQDVCFASAAFDQVGYPVVAYQIRNETYVTYWNVLTGQYVTTSALPLRFPYLFQPATIEGYAYVPNSNVLLVGVNGRNVVLRDQANDYAQETVLFTVHSGLGSVSEVVLSGLRYKVKMTSGQEFKSGLYPYITLTYRKANAAKPEVVPGHDFLSRITEADVQVRDVVKAYSLPAGTFTAVLVDADVLLRAIVQAYSVNAVFNATLTDATVAVADVVKSYSAIATLNATIADSDVVLRQIVLPYNPPGISLSAAITDAEVILQ